MAAFGASETFNAGTANDRLAIQERSFHGGRGPAYFCSMWNGGRYCYLAVLVVVVVVVVVAEPSLVILWRHVDQMPISIQPPAYPIRQLSRLLKTLLVGHHRDPLLNRDIVAFLYDPAK
jgi:hypothetical protein